MSDLRDEVLQYLRAENIWANFERILAAINTPRTKARKKKIQPDELMPVVGLLVSERMLLVEFFDGDAKYAARPFPND